MNLALAATVLAILLTSPLLFLYLYGKAAHARRMPKLTLIEYYLLSSVLSLFIHTAIASVFSLNIDFNFLAQVVSGQLNEVLKNSNNILLRHYISDFAKYNFCVCLGAAILGYLSGLVATHENFRRMAWLQKIRKNKKPNKLFQYYNNWWYIFRANEYDSNSQTSGMDKPLVFVDALVATNDVTILYSGVLNDFVVKDENLDYIYLERVSKRFLTKNSSPDLFSFRDTGEIAFTVPRILGIPGSQIVNLYIRLFSTAPDFKRNATPQVDLVAIIQNAEPIDNPLGT